MPSQQNRTGYLPPTLVGRFSVIIALILLPLAAQGQTAIASWTLSNSNAANSTGYTPTVNFDNQVDSISSITIGSTVRTIASNADNIYIRRSGGAGNNANIWEVATSASNLVGTNTSASTLENVLLGNNTLMGANDLFTNTGGSPAPANNNIERVDYSWNGGFQAVPDQGFAIFDRAATKTAADGFQIAVFTGWNAGTSTPTAYSGNVVEVTAGAGSQYGAALDWDPLTAGVQTTFTYQILRFTSGDSLTPLSIADTTSSQSVFGIYISFADLGIAAGTTVYGYSIMANDVTNVTANLVNWNNATFYPTDTPDTSGSIDLLGVNGRRYVPEPSTYGALFIGLTAMYLGWRRWRRGISAPAA
jgi:hypothetical protein